MQTDIPASFPMHLQLRLDLLDFPAILIVCLVIRLAAFARAGAAGTSHAATKPEHGRIHGTQCSKTHAAKRLQICATSHQCIPNRSGSCCCSQLHDTNANCTSSAINVLAHTFQHTCYLQISTPCRQCRPYLPLLSMFMLTQWSIYLGSEAVPQL